MNSSNDIQDLLQNLAIQNKSSANLSQFLQNCEQNDILRPDILKGVFKSLNITKSKWDIPNQASNALKHFTYKKFTDFEDAQLKLIVNYFGPKNWAFIASLMPNKTARQCRDRYKNYLAPGFIHSKWTKEEDAFLAQKYQEIGPHWSEIQKFFPYRTSNSIKNRFNYSVCKNINLKEHSSITSIRNIENKQQIKNDLCQDNNNDIFEFDFQDGYQDLELNENDFNLYSETDDNIF